jgi:hypothetical protein
MTNWLKEIKHHRKKIYSQCGEEGFIEFILKNIGVENGGYLIEFGAGDGVSLSNSHYFIKEKGFVSSLYDGDPKGSSDVMKQWIDLEFAENLAKGVSHSKAEIDLFLIDLDGNDLFILNAFIGNINQVEIKPKLVVCEINPIWKRDEAFTIKYNPQHVWKNNTYYGMSLKAAEIMMESHGYTLIFVNDSLNAYFLRNDLLQGIPEPVEYKVKRDHAKGDGEWINVMENFNG